MTLIEACVVMLITSIISLAGIQMLVSLYDGQLKTSEFWSQQSTLETYYGYMAAKTAIAQRGDLGLTFCQPLHPDDAGPMDVCAGGPDDDDNDSTYDVWRECEPEAEAAGDCQTIIDPVTVSGDQIVLRSDERCYRIWYSDADDRISAASAESCSMIYPHRGANEPGSFSPGQVGYDPYLDSPESSNVISLAENIVSDRPAHTFEGPAQLLAVFEFLNPRSDPFPGAYEQAAMGDRDDASESDFYADPEKLEQIFALDTRAYVGGLAAGSTAAQIPARDFHQTFSLQQVCKLGDDDIGQVAGGDLEGSYPNPELKEDAVGARELENGAVSSDELASNAVTTGKIATGAVGSNQLTNGSVSAAKLGVEAFEQRLGTDLAFGTGAGEQTIPDTTYTTQTAGDWLITATYDIETSGLDGSMLGELQRNDTTQPPTAAWGVPDGRSTVSQTWLLNDVPVGTELRLAAKREATAGTATVHAGSTTITGYQVGS